MIRCVDVLVIHRISCVMCSIILILWSQMYNEIVQSDSEDKYFRTTSDIITIDKAQCIAL